MLRRVPGGVVGARRGCARIGLLFCGCTGRGCRGSLGKKIGMRGRRAAERFQDPAASRPLRLERYGGGSRGRVKSMGVTDIGGQGLRQLRCRNERCSAG